MGSVYAVQVKIGVCLRSMGDFLGLATLRRSKLGSVCAMQVIFGVRLRYAVKLAVRLRSTGEIWGPSTPMQVNFWVHLRCAGKIWGPSTLKR